jgi:hypothetical protein
VEEDDEMVNGGSSNSGVSGSVAGASVTISNAFSESDLKAELISNLMETAMSKKFDEIKNNIVTPFQQISNLFASSNNSANMAQVAKLKSSFMHKSSFSAGILNNLGASSAAAVAAAAAAAAAVASGSSHTSSSSSTGHHQMDRYSFAYDTRLDTSVYQTLENELFVQMTQQNDAINTTLDQLNSMQSGPASVVVTATVASDLENESLLSNESSSSSVKSSSSIGIIQQTLENLFQDLTNINLESLLTFWLTLSSSDDLVSVNSPAPTTTNSTPTTSLSPLLLSPPLIPVTTTSATSTSLLVLKDSTISYLLETLCTYPFMTVKLWFLTFKILLSLLSTTTTTTTNLLSSRQNETLLYKLVLKYLNAGGEQNNQQQANDERTLSGDECNQAFIDFLHKLTTLSTTTTSTVPETTTATNDNYLTNSRFNQTGLFSILNKLIDTTTSSDYIYNNNSRSIDSQVAFIEFLLAQQHHYQLSSTHDYYSSVDNQLIEAYLMNLSRLIQRHLHLSARLTFKGQLSPRSCFSSVLSTLLFGGTTTTTAATASSSAQHHPSSTG